MRGEVFLPGDKSIACRAVIISAISQGNTLIKNFPFNQDCLSAVRVFKALGIKIKSKNDPRDNTAEILVCGGGFYGLIKPGGPLYMGESGTTLRLSMGVLAAQKFSVSISAGQSLSLRPMRRVTEPLRKMGAKITAKVRNKNSQEEEYPPLKIEGRPLKALIYKIPVASAQVKSAILLAGLYAQGKTYLSEPISTRDHTERMLRFFGADIKFGRGIIEMLPVEKLVSPDKLHIPGDISSAGFFMVMAAILAHSSVTIRKAGLNPARIGLIEALKKMGADIKIIRRQEEAWGYEPVGDIIVRSSLLKGIVIDRTQVPSLIDELPVLMVAASCARGETVLEGVGELRVKETDRISSMQENLARMGVDIRVCRKKDREDIIIRGAGCLRAAKLRSFGDHRTAMSMIVAGLKARGQSSIDDISCINKSFPGFLSILKALRH
ncbi:MAG: 3-phosphoshikimate 1-carboxyvinyltransferase [Candidatus Omnitrophota bacterium]